MSFAESQRESEIIELLGVQGFPYVPGQGIEHDDTEILIEDDLCKFLAGKYSANNITADEVSSIIKKAESLPVSNLYESNKTFCKWPSEYCLLKRANQTQKDLYIRLIEYANATLIGLATKTLSKSADHCKDSFEQTENFKKNSCLVLIEANRKLEWN
ncbi:hypothetical protein [Rheinheimera soli]|uniref:hypothetical protein n=1 Tax=Rheinheimera soli TaxID=443616 RepID=UPI001E592785|nr:hypothetical protein [Rheinheimera soli]